MYRDMPMGENLPYNLFQRLTGVETVSIGENIPHELFQRLKSIETVSMERISH